jgi:hypothetical protein
VRHRGEHGFEAGLADDLGDLPGLGSDYDPFADVEVNETPDDSEDEWFSGEEPKGLSGEAAGAQPSGNHAKDWHRPRYKICAAGTSDGDCGWGYAG